MLWRATYRKGFPINSTNQNEAKKINNLNINVSEKVKWVL